MLNKYILKLSLNNIKFNKKIYYSIFLTIVISFLIATISNILNPSFQKMTYLKRANIYGCWDSVVLNASDKEIETLNNYQNIEIGKSYVGGNLENDNGYIGSYDHSAQEYASLQFNEGHYPINTDEIAISDRISKKYNKNTNEKIKITFQNNLKKTISRQYKIVGIYKDYELSRECRFLSVITNTVIKNSQKDIYIKTNNREKLWNVLSNDANIKQKINNINIVGQTKVFISQMDEIEYKVNDDVKTYYTEITIITLVAILSSLFCHFEKRKQNLMLFRCIGLTKFQTNFMITFEILIISLISSLIGIGLGFILSYFMLYAYCFVSSNIFVYILNLNILLKQYLYCYLAMFLSMIFIMIKINDISLTGNINYITTHIKPILNYKRFIFRFTINKILKQKFITIILCVLSSFIIFKGVYLGTIFHDFISEIKPEHIVDCYSIEILSSDGIQNKDINILRNLNKSSLTCCREKEAYVYWKDINKYKDFHIISPYKRVVSQFTLFCFDEDKEKYNKIKKSLTKGRMPKNRNEVVLINSEENNMVNDINEIIILSDNKEKKVKVVGISLNSSLDIISIGLLVNEDGYLDCFNNEYNSISIKGSLKDAYNAKRVIVDIESKDSSISIITNFYEIVDSNINIRDLIITECIYNGILLILLLELILLIREIQINVQIHEFRLYKLIGLTNIQLNMVELLYLSSIYWVSVLLVIIVWSIYVLYNPIILMINSLPFICIVYFIYLLIVFKPYQNLKRM